MPSKAIPHFLGPFLLNLPLSQKQSSFGMLPGAIYMKEVRFLALRPVPEFERCLDMSMSGRFLGHCTSFVWQA